MLFMAFCCEMKIAAISHRRIIYISIYCGNRNHMERARDS